MNYKIANLIPDDMFMLRCKILFERVPNEETNIYASEVTEMFNLYNDKMLPRESGRSCPSCRLRVYRRLKNFYEPLKNNETPNE